MFLRRQFSKVVVVADLTGGGQVSRPEDGQLQCAARRNGLQQLIRAIHHLGPSEVVFVTRVVGNASPGFGLPVRDEGGIDLLCRAIQELNSGIYVIKLSKAEGISFALKQCHEFFGKRPTLLLQPSVISALKPSYFGNICDYGIVHDVTLIGSTPPECRGRGKPTSSDSLAGSMAARNFRRGTFEAPFACSLPRPSLSGCFYLANDFWQALQASMRVGKIIDFLAFVESLPGAMPFLDVRDETLMAVPAKSKGIDAGSDRQAVNFRVSRRHQLVQSVES